MENSKSELVVRTWRVLGEFLLYMGSSFLGMSTAALAQRADTDILSGHE